MNDVIFIKGKSATKRTAAGKDYISGLVLYSDTLPSGFTSNDNVKQVFSLLNAENLGITNTFTDETPATATYLVTNAGTTGDTINIKVKEPLGVTVDLGTYTKVAADSTVTKVGDAIALIINNGTRTHGYTAINATGTVTITAKAGLGVWLNSNTPYTVTIGGNAIPTLAGTLTQPSNGVAGKLAVWNYHISEFFRGNPSSELWVGIFPVPSPYTFAEITTLQTKAGGSIRQVGIFKDSAAYASSDITLIDTVIKTYNDAKHKPLSALYAGNLKATTDITAIADVSLLSANKASSIIGQDGYGRGAYLYYTTGKSVTQLGVALGMTSLASVSEDIANPARFNITDGTENNVPAFANGQLLSDTLLSDSAIDSINTKRHIFGRSFVGYSGTFFNDNHTAITATSDYAYMSDNRTIDKAIRGLYIALVPYLASRIQFNADGTMSDNTISFFQNECLQVLYQMAREGDLSTVTDEDVYIDPSQLVKTTSKLIINVELNIVGIARNIEVPISFK